MVNHVNITVMTTHIDPKHPPQPPKLPVEPGEPPMPQDDDPELVADDDPFENPPAYEVPQPGEGP